MQVAVLGSGSRGNAIVVSTDSDSLLVDAGFGLRSLTRRARAVGIDLQSLSGIVLTHEHGDHARGAGPLAARTGCSVHATRGTLRALTAALRGTNAVPLPIGPPVMIGPFRVLACRTGHDALEPVAVVVESPRGDERIGVAYDLGTATQSVRAFLRDLSCLIIEANHDDRLLREGPYPPSVRERIAGPCGHLSNREAAALAAHVAHAGLRTVVLAHLSDSCNRVALAEETVGAALRSRAFGGRMLVAGQGEPLTPFSAGVTRQLRLEGID